MSRKERSDAKKTLPTLYERIQLEAVRLADESDKPMTEVAREFGVRVNKLYK